MARWQWPRWCTARTTISSSASRSDLRVARLSQHGLTHTLTHTHSRARPDGQRQQLEQGCGTGLSWSRAGAGAGARNGDRDGDLARATRYHRVCAGRLGSRRRGRLHSKGQGGEGEHADRRAACWSAWCGVVRCGAWRVRTRSTRPRSSRRSAISRCSPRGWARAAHPPGAARLVTGLPRVPLAFYLRPVSLPLWPSLLCLGPRSTSSRATGHPARPHAMETYGRCPMDAATSGVCYPGSKQQDRARTWDGRWP